LGGALRESRKLKAESRNQNNRKIKRESRKLKAESDQESGNRRGKLKTEIKNKTEIGK